MEFQAATLPTGSSHLSHTSKFVRFASKLLSALFSKSCYASLPTLYPAISTTISVCEIVKIQELQLAITDTFGDLGGFLAV